MLIVLVIYAKCPISFSKPLLTEFNSVFDGITKLSESKTSASFWTHIGNMAASADSFAGKHNNFSSGWGHGVCSVSMKPTSMHSHFNVLSSKPAWVLLSNSPKQLYIPPRRRPTTKTQYFTLSCYEWMAPKALEHLHARAQPFVLRKFILLLRG